MPKIYTKTGDKGTSGLFTGERFPKHSIYFHAYGNVDELVALIGLALTSINDKEIKTILSSVQIELLQVGSDLASPPNAKKSKDKIKRISPEQTTKLERTIDKLEADLPELKNFIISGGSLPASYLHVARTVCRRAERFVSALTAEGNANPEVLIYLNRLSDLLFVLARALNKRARVEDVVWVGTK